MSSIIENTLALSGTFLLAVGIIFLASSLIILLIGLVTKDPLQKTKTYSLLKKILLLAAILLLVGTGVCALQFNFFPLRIG
ncbi:MAG: hypothetical protein H7Z73_11050 [Candidatus Saccharibacteria bacterium]|nr:hypothetical protein [Moraxellaceae bacterium]